MTEHRIFAMEFAKVYPLYVQKAERKGRTKAEVDQVISWLTGYDAEGLQRQIDAGNDLRTFFAQAPALNPNSSLIKGVVCGVRVEEVDDPLMQKIRYLDKLVDELAKGKPIEKVLRRPEKPVPFAVSRPCPVCDGEGAIEHQPCAACQGTGVGVFYHGTKADLETGDSIEPGRTANFGEPGRAANHVYLTGTLDAATWGAELAQGVGRGRIYTVEPTGAIEDDPNLTNQRFPGNPTKSYRSQAPLRVTGELVDWQGHSPDELKAMRDNLERLAQEGVEPID